MMGAKGDKGDAGKGISSTAVTYQASVSETTTPTGTWSATIPSVSASQFLWTRTVLTYGKDTCGSQQIPEIVLMQQTAIALGMKEFDETALAARIAEIKVPGENQLTFVFKDGYEVGITWKTKAKHAEKNWRQQPISF